MGGAHVAELRVTSTYIDVLETQRARLIAALTPHITPAAIDSAHRRSARLSVRLDASPLDDTTADAVDRGQVPARPVGTVSGRDGASWASALKLDGMPTQDIAAIEYAGLRAAQRDEQRWAATLFATPHETLVAMHRRVVAGLVSDKHLGSLRQTSRALSDGAQGRMIFSAPAPHHLPGLLADLDAWLRDAPDRHSPLVIAGVVHLRLVHWQPFEAGNGRVARTAARVALRATEGDPWGLAVPEESYIDDQVGYVAEIAATIRRRSDLRPWVERTAEAVVTSLERTARDVGGTSPGPFVRGLHMCEHLRPGATITVTEYAVGVGVDRRVALLELNGLCWAGLLGRDPGTHGLRYVRLAGDGVQ